LIDGNRGGRQKSENQSSRVLIGGILRFSFPDTVGADLLTLDGAPKLTAGVDKLVADDSPTLCLSWRRILRAG
jgi:hypothetical protein